jgi:hypothetical protein
MLFRACSLSVCVLLAMALVLAPGALGAAVPQITLSSFCQSLLLLQLTAEKADVQWQRQRVQPINPDHEFSSGFFLFLLLLLMLSAQTILIVRCPRAPAPSWLPARAWPYRARSSGEPLVSTGAHCSKTKEKSNVGESEKSMDTGSTLPLVSHRLIVCFSLVCGRLDRSGYLCPSLLRPRKSDRQCAGHTLFGQLLHHPYPCCGPGGWLGFQCRCLHPEHPLYLFCARLHCSGLPSHDDGLAERCYLVLQGLRNKMLVHGATIQCLRGLEHQEQPRLFGAHGVLLCSER